MEQQLVFDEALIRKYDTSGPRYTSYPTAPQFTTDFTAEDYRQAALLSNEDAIPRPLSLYLHIPFCNTVCYYCACNKVVTKDRGKAEPYLQRLYNEISMQARLFDQDRHVMQLHLGGGTPTFISDAQMTTLMHQLRRHFRLSDDDSAEYSIEIDPREVSDTTIGVLRELGFNRISLGVQDVNDAVQQAVNRRQSIALTESVIQTIRDHQYHSISLDLMYGLPLQTPDSFNQTLDRVIQWQPDRISVFNYAHMPHLFKPQRRISQTDLPTAKEKLAILHNTVTRLLEAGYVYIGMDHFARPNDELAIAQQQGTLSRNFQGYSTHAECDLIAMGITAIGKVGDTYSQNVRRLDEYSELIDKHQLPVMRGYQLSIDDLCRRQLIEDLMCQYRVNFDDYELGYGIRFGEYFQHELQQLQAMQQDGLLIISDTAIEVQPVGRLLIRNICMVFDHYLPAATEQKFSRVI